MTSANKILALVKLRSLRGVDSHTRLNVILKAKQIPIDADVLKINGECVFTLADSFKIYDISMRKTGSGSKEKKIKEIKAAKGTRFLLGDRGNISQVSEETLLVWRVSPTQFTELLEEALRNPIYLPKKVEKITISEEQ